MYLTAVLAARRRAVYTRVPLASGNALMTMEMDMWLGLSVPRHS